jgi:hypothetical protein
MSLIHILVSFFVLKGLMVWPFYFTLKWKPLQIGFLLALAEAPFLTLLYHDTEIDFWVVFFLVIIFDFAVYFLLLQRTLWKAILLAILYNFIGFIYFTIVNG